MLGRKAFLLLILLVHFSTNVSSQISEDHLRPESIKLEMSEIIVKGIPVTMSIRLADSLQKFDLPVNFYIYIGDSSFRAIANQNIKVVFDREEEVTIVYKDQIIENINVNPIPLWLSILPPLIAIVMALLFREVFSALFMGILVGTSIIYYYKGFSFIAAIFHGLFALIDSYVLKSMLDEGHLSIIVFSMLIGATVSLITSNGGMKGVVKILSKYAKDARSGQRVTWLLGILIFFDDYANTLVVGNTMRPVADRLKISREKLSYIVDSTAAPIASIAFVTTWIGAELSYIEDGIRTIGLNTSPYNVFLQSLKYSFYPILTLAFVFMLISMGKEFGPMLKAERLKRRKGKTGAEIESAGNDSNDRKIPDSGWYNAVIPVLVIILGTITGLFYTGWNSEVWHDPAMSFSAKCSYIIGNSNSYKALLWSSLSGLLVALAMTILQRILDLKTSMESVVGGFKTMMTAILILVLAWSIALTTEDLRTAEFISRLLLGMSVSPYLLPAMTFIFAALVAFSTGSSWGTMAILYPLILPSSWLLAQENGLDHQYAMSIFANVVSCVLSGSVLGDHCSPISDTTILSSLASSCNHIDHVRTQLPYALTVGAVSIAFGNLPVAYGVPAYILFPLGLVILFLIIRIFGKNARIVDSPQVFDKYS